MTYVHYSNNIHKHLEAHFVDIVRSLPECLDRIKEDELTSFMFGGKPPIVANFLPTCYWLKTLPILITLPWLGYSAHKIDSYIA